MSKTAKLNINTDKIEIKFWVESREEFFSLLEQIKTLPGRVWNAQRKMWTCPPSRFAIEQLSGWGFDIDENLFLFLKQEQKIELPDTWPFNQLRDYQREGVAFMQTKNGRALIGDDMGLGKTLQSIAYLQLNPEIRPALVICPASLKLNWQREIQKWTKKNNSITLISGRSNTVLEKADIHIINYDIVADNLELLIKQQYKIIVIDECHQLRNYKAQRTKAVKELKKTVDKLICLSGTPIVNRPVEFFNTLNMLDPETWNSWYRYVNRYCNPESNGFGITYKGANNTEELHKILTETVMLRRLKKDVLEELPEKQISIIPVELSDRSSYRAAENNLETWLSENKGKQAAITALSEIEHLKQIAAELKLKNCIAWIEDYLESEGKLVVFATHHFVIDELKKYFGDRAVKLDGRDSLEQKQQAVDSFQNDPSIELFIGNIQASGVGITLTAASSVAFLELAWTPGDHMQCEDRIHRIGQEADSVNAFYLIAENTIEEDIMDLLDEKRQVLDAVLDGKETKQESLLGELLRRLRKDKVA